MAQSRGHRINAGAKKSQQCHKHLFQNSTFASEKPQVRTWGRQTCFFSQAPSNLGTPLHITIVKSKWRNLLQTYLPVSGNLSITNYLKQNAVDYLSHLTKDNNLKVDKKVYYFENKHNFPSKNAWGTRRDKHTKKLESNNYAGTSPWQVFLHPKGIENDQRLFFHVTAGNIKFAVDQSPNSHPFHFFVRNAAISR